MWLDSISFPVMDGLESLSSTWAGPLEGIVLLGACSSVLCPSQGPPAQLLWCPAFLSHRHPSVPRAGFGVAFVQPRWGEDGFPGAAPSVPLPGRTWGRWGLSGWHRPFSPCTPQWDLHPSQRCPRRGRTRPPPGAQHRARPEEPAPRWLPWDLWGQLGANLMRNPTGSARHCTLLCVSSEHDAQEREIPVPCL